MLKVAGVRRVGMLFAILGVSACFAQGNGPVVRTDAGAVRGTQAAQAGVTVFKGIPFAAAPVGPLRWRAPQPVKAWSGVRPATEFGASCMQHEVKELLPWTEEFMTHNEVSEDCLFLNVWTPHAERAAHLEVVVFIHGGAFTSGAGGIAIYDGTDLAATGLVVVTINYRLGVFGFFAHPELTAESEHHSSGNYALLDQMAALQWVRRNIAAFGGDPKRVMIWGQSAGAFSVDDLLASPLAAGLFQRAQADSGIGIAALPMQDLKGAEQAGVKFAEAHHADSLNALRAIAAGDLLSWSHGGNGRFGPIVDGWVLPDTPLAMMAKDADNDVPVITGYQANDGLLFSGPVQTPDQFAAMAKRQYGEMADEFLRLYPAKTADDAKQMLAESIQDRDRVSMYLWASRRGSNHHAPVFTYFFDRAIPWPQHPEFGAFHSGELPYFFLNLRVMDRPWEKQDRDLAQTAATYLKDFAASGNPNGGHLPQWAPVSTAEPETMEIGSRTAEMPLAEGERLAFWEKFFTSPAGTHASPF